MTVVAVRLQRTYGKRIWLLAVAIISYNRLVVMCHIIVIGIQIRSGMVRINIDIPDDAHARLKMLASAEGKGFYE